MRLLYLLFILLFTSCGIQWQYSTLNNAAQIDSIYRSNDYQIDTISSVSDLRWKLRTDFNFRYDFAQYAMNQPYSWYWNNPRLEGIWRPYNRFDVYFYSNWFWNDWAFNYPFNYNFGWNNWNSWGWNRPWYGWNRPYNPWTSWGNSWYNGPFNNSGYNIVWNASRRGSNIAYINGPRGSRNIENTITNNRRIRSYPNNNNIDKIVNNLRENINNNNTNIRIYNKPNNINNTNSIRINNNIRPNYNNSKPIINNNSRPSYNTRINNVNSTRSSNTNISRGNSRGKN